MFRLFCFDVRGGGGGALPVTGIPLECNVLFILVQSKSFPASAKPYAYIVRESPLGVQRAIHSPSSKSAHSFHLFPCVGFSKDTHPNDQPVRRSKWLRNFNSSRKIEASAAFRKLLFFFCTVYLQICLSASLDDFLENSGKALVISKRLKSVCTEKSSKIGKSWPQLKT